MAKITSNLTLVEIAKYVLYRDSANRPVRFYIGAKGFDMVVHDRRGKEVEIRLVWYGKSKRLILHIDDLERITEKDLSDEIEVVGKRW